MDRRHFITALAASVAASGATQAQAQTPAGTLRIIVPFAPGGPIDVTARVLAEQARASSKTARVAAVASASTWWPRRRPTA